MPTRSLKPAWETIGPGVQLYAGHAYDILSKMPAQSVHCIVTSPPYWALRDYETESPLELGSEQTFAEYVDRLVRLLGQAYRVLRDDGTLWLNIGDSYNQNTGKGFNKQARMPDGSRNTRNAPGAPVPAGNLLLAPWRVAMSMQNTGWFLRADNIWHKPNPNPDSATNRCVRATECMFMFTKKASGYFYDMDATAEESLEGGTRNKRNVWTIPTEGYAGAHYATYPTKLVEPCILMGTSAWGCCAECGAPWERIVERVKLQRKRPNSYTKRTGKPGTGNVMANDNAGMKRIHKGWRPMCTCPESVEAPPAPATVLDPFVGSGTTCATALRHGRHSIGIDLSEKHLHSDAVARITAEAVACGRSDLVQRATAVDIGGDSLL